MTTAVLVLGLLTASPPPTDTILSVRRGDVLRLENFSGDLVVRTWERAEARVELDGRDRSPVSVRRRGNRLEVGVADRKGRERNRSYLISVPRWLEVEVSGRELNVTVEGLEANLDVTTREGDITVRDHVGHVVARTLEGSMEVRQSRGRFELTSLDDDVKLYQVQGDISVEANDGDIEMVDVDSRVVSASTVDGHIDFSGAVYADGRYELVTHDGDISFAVPADVHADVFVATYDGEFTTEFPIVLQRLESGRELRFQLGRGGARVRLQAFDGEISLLRHGGGGR